MHVRMMWQFVIGNRSAFCLVICWVNETLQRVRWTLQSYVEQGSPPYLIRVTMLECKQQPRADQ